MQTRLYYRLANEILFGNLIANFIGNLATDIIFSLHMSETPERVISKLEELDFIYICFSIKGTEIIVSSILNTVKIFKEALEPEDDMTLVVIKIKNTHLP